MDFKRPTNRSAITPELFSTVHKQLEALREGNITKAYDEVGSKEFQNETSLEDFQEFIAVYPVLTSHETYEVVEHAVENAQGRVLVDLTMQDVLYPLEYVLVRENGQWKIWSLKLMLPVPEQGVEPDVFLKPIQEHLHALENSEDGIAYDLVAQDFKDATNLAAFRKFIAAFPIFRQHDTFKLEEPFIEGEMGGLVELSRGNESMTVEYTLSAKEGDWKILGIQVLQKREPLSNV